MRIVFPCKEEISSLTPGIVWDILFIEAELMGVAREPVSGDSPAGVSSASFSVADSSKTAPSGVRIRLSYATVIFIISFYSFIFTETPFTSTPSSAGIIKYFLPFITFVSIR